MTNPLLPAGQNNDNSYLMPDKQKPDIAPAGEGGSAAVEMIRSKIQRLYADEPNAGQELREAANPVPGGRSKHQDFMYRLSTSGRSLADIQTAWHEYYVGLPDNEKHEVWQEFYAAAAHTPFQKLMQPQPELPAAGRPQTQLQPASAAKPAAATHSAVVGHTAGVPLPMTGDKRSLANIRQEILSRVTAGGKLRGKHHLQSLAFGLGAGMLVILVLLFGFFNQVIIAPFIQPSSHAAATPVIVDPASVSLGSTPQIIIPKINVQIPVDYTQTSTVESTIENALNSGVVHYPTTVMPGQLGNAAFFGHSSNNIFNPGKYKFAFVLLHDLVAGDTFYLTRDGKIYTYKVISRQIVPPNDVSVLGPVAGQTATATLITCDPPGTSINRLVVVGQQVSPAPSTDTAPSTPPPAISASAAPSELPGNGPTLWSRLWQAIFH